MNNRTTFFSLISAAATALLALSACASTPMPDETSDAAPATLTPVSFAMNFKPSGAQVGFTYAKELGLYEKAGLDVSIAPGTGSVATAQLVASGKIDIGYTDAPAAFSTAANGGDILVVSPVLQTNGFAVISLAETGLENIEDLKGMRIGLQPATGNAQLFNAILASAGLNEDDVEIVSVQPSALQAALLAKQADVIITGGDTQVPLLKLAGHKLKYWMFYEVGVPTIGLSIAASSTYLNDNADIVKKFTEASLQGWAAAKENPSAAAKSMIDQFPTAGTVEQVEAMLRVDLDLLCTAGGSEMGPVSNEFWTKTAELLKDAELLPQDTDVMGLVAQEYAGENFPKC